MFVIDRFPIYRHFIEHARFLLSEKLCVIWKKQLSESSLALLFCCLFFKPFITQKILAYFVFVLTFCMTEGVSCHYFIRESFSASRLRFYQKLNENHAFFCWLHRSCFWTLSRCAAFYSPNCSLSDRASSSSGSIKKYSWQLLHLNFRWCLCCQCRSPHVLFTRITVVSLWQQGQW
jgi:hypothetical protein